MLVMLLLAALGPPAYAEGRYDESPFGIVCPWPGIEETGAGWVRCGAGATQLVDWGQVEPEPGRFDWAAADRELHEWDKPWKLTPLPILAYTAPWASSGPDGDRGYPPRDLRHYARFVRESVARYRDDIRCWEVWNEPNIEFFEGTIPEYVDMLKAASIAAHQADPDCHIVFGGTAGVDSRFIERCYEHGAGPYFDVMAVHPYQWGRAFNDGWHREKIERLRGLMDRYLDFRKPVWFTEVGWSTAEVSDEDQARLLVQSFVSSLGLHELGVAKVFWFSVKDWGGPGHGIFADDGSRKASFEAYRVMTRELAGKVHYRRAETGEVRCYCFAGPGDRDAVLVFWSPMLEPMAFELPTARLEPLEGPFVLVDMYGNEEQIGPEQLAHLTATPEPQYLRLGPDGLDGFRGTDTLPEDWTMPPGYWAPPGPREVREWWASVQIPEGTARLWFVPGEEREVTVNLWNLSDEPQQARTRLCFVGEDDRMFGGASASRDLPANACAPVTLSFTAPADAEPGLRPMAVWFDTQTDRDRQRGSQFYRLHVRIAEGPTVEFLANSHIERLVYLRPDHKSGCSESCRFGSEWTYAFDVPFACDARLQVLYGAHQAGPFRLEASQSGTDWTTLLDGRGDRAWREVTIEGLKPGKLYLRFSGENVQLEELVLTWIR